MKQHEQLQLNTTNNRQSKYALHENRSIANVTAVAGEHLVTVDSKDSFASGILVKQDGTKKFVLF